MDYIQPSEFGFGTASALLESADPFPVDFDAAWQWLGYSSKQKAKDKLIRNFEKGFDYSTEWRNVLPGGVYNHLVENIERGLDYVSGFSDDRLKTPQGGRPSEFIKLTTDCFKSLGMMAGTEKGKEVRRYFLECERQLKQTTSIQTDRRLTAIERRLDRLEAKSNRRDKPKSALPRKQYLYTTAPQLQLLLDFLREHRGERFIAEELAQQINAAISSIRRLLSILYRQGLIDKQRNPNYTASTGDPKYFYSIR